MHRHSVREDQAEHLVEELETAYRVYSQSPNRPWLSQANRDEIRRHLETSVRNARGALEIMAQQSGMSPALQMLHRKLILWTEMAAGDLNRKT
jgi:hypothetical protein